MPIVPDLPDENRANRFHYDQARLLISRARGILLYLQQHPDKASGAAISACLETIREGIAIQRRILKLDGKFGVSGESGFSWEMAGSEKAGDDDVSSDDGTEG